MYGFYTDNYYYSVLGYVLIRNIIYQNRFSALTAGEKRALLDGAGGPEKQRQLLDYLTGVDTNRAINPFFDVF